MNKFKQVISIIFGIKTAESSSDINMTDEPGYVKITDRDIKGLDTITRDRQLRIVFSLWLKNLFAKAILDTINDFVFGDGFSYDIEFKNDKTPKYKLQQARAILDEFWESNKFDLKLEKKGIDLSLNGMLCLPAFVNKEGGKTKLGFVDPRNIDRVITNPLNVEEIQEIKLKNINGQGAKTLKVIRINEDDVFADSYGLLQGETFFFCINNVSNQPEGVSDLLVSADIIDETGTLIFNILKHSELAYLVFQDVTVDGDAKKWADDNPIPQPGDRIVHNKKVEFKLVTPDIQATNSADIVRLFKNLILFSKRMPEHWFADGGNTNLATAVEQGTAVFRMLKNRQQYWVYILEQILSYVLHQAFINKKEGFSLTKEDLLNNIKVKIIVPEFETKNLDKIATSVNDIADFLKKGIDNKMISPETAGKIYRGLTELFGYTIKEDNELEKLLAAYGNEPAPAPEPKPNEPGPKPDVKPIK